MRHAAANESIIRFDCAERKPAPCKNFLVRVIHFLIAETCTVFVGIETVGVLHDEFAATHQAETRTDFIAEFGLDLVAVHGELTIRAYLTAKEIGDDFFMRGAEAKIAVMPVLASK